MTAALLALLVMRGSEPRSGTVEVDVAIDQNFFWHTVSGYRMSVPDHEIGVLADVNRADVIIHADDPSRIQRDHLQGFFFGGATVTDRLSGFLLAAAGVILGITLNRDAYAFAHSHRSVPRDRVPCILLKAPPVGEGGNSDIVGRDLVGDLVGFGRAMEGANLIAELFCQGY